LLRRAVPPSRPEVPLVGQNIAVDDLRRERADLVDPGVERRDGFHVHMHGVLLCGLKRSAAPPRSKLVPPPWVRRPHSKSLVRAFMVRWLDFIRHVVRSRRRRHPPYRRRRCKSGFGLMRETASLPP